MALLSARIPCSSAVETSAVRCAGSPSTAWKILGAWVCAAAMRSNHPSAAGTLSRVLHQDRIAGPPENMHRCAAPPNGAVVRPPSLTHIAQMGGGRTIKNLVNAKLRRRLAQVLEETPPAAEQYGCQGDFQLLNDAQVQVLLDH